MNSELALKFIAAIVGLIGAAKIFYDFSVGKKSRMRDEYKFAKEFFADLSSNPVMHPFLREKGYQAIAGTSSISAEIIEYLLSLTGPEKAMRDYVLGEHYLEPFAPTGNLKINFKKKYQKVLSRRIRIYGYFVLYLILAVLAISPLILNSVYQMSLETTLSLFLICTGIFGPYALISLRAGVRVYRAQMLVSNQDKHTRKIMLSKN